MEGQDRQRPLRTETSSNIQHCSLSEIPALVPVRWDYIPQNPRPVASLGIPGNRSPRLAARALRKGEGKPARLGGKVHIPPSSSRPFRLGRRLPCSPRLRGASVVIPILRHLPTCAVRVSSLRTNSLFPSGSLRTLNGRLVKYGRFLLKQPVTSNRVVESEADFVNPFPPPS